MPSDTKGTLNLILIFELLAVLLVGYLMISTGQAFANSDTTFKINTAEEMRMMVNTLAGVPGDAIVQYPQNISNYFIVLNTGSVSVFTEGEAENKWISRTFVLPQGYDATGIAKNVENVCFQKNGKHITIRECKESEF